MRTWIIALMAVSLMLVPPAAMADGDEAADPPEQAHYGICTAEDASQPGDEASNGTVSSTPPFNNTSDEECENADRPGNDSAPEDPGPPEDVPGEAPEDPGDDNAGDDHAPDEGDDSGDDQAPEDPGGDNDDQGEDNRP